MSKAPSQEEVVASRLRLRERFLKKIESTPGVSDAKPLGTGPKNRHGMPRVPVGQTPTAPGKWPVLDLGAQPAVTAESWQLVVDGACKAPLVLDWGAFMALEQVDDVSDFHCVTGWSKLDVAFRGVRFATIAALVEPDDAATHVVCHAYDGYDTNLPLAEALKDDVLLVHGFEGKPLPPEHGGPVRLVTPQLYAWKGAKWLKRIEFLKADRKGFWELRGYSNSAHPWRNDRYS